VNWNLRMIDSASQPRISVVSPSKSELSRSLHRGRY